MPREELWDVPGFHSAGLTLQHYLVTHTELHEVFHTQAH